MKKLFVKPFPWPLHLALLALLLPLWIFLFYELPFCLIDQTFGSAEILCLFVVPAAMVVAILLKGSWRLAVVVTMGSLFLCTMEHDNSGKDNDDDRVLEFIIRKDTFPNGTEIFCNEIKMGEVPCKFTVRQLKEKVPRWTTPPRQERYFEDKTPLYTWIPWDGFLRDRYEARRQADLKDGSAEIDRQSEFWWSFRYKGSTAFGRLNDWYFRNNDFDSLRYASDYFSFFYPATYAECDLLLNILNEDSPPEGPRTPSPQWVTFVAENGRLLDDLLARWDLIDKDNPIEPALQALARKRYGLSETPTPKECDLAIKQMLHENKQCSVASRDGSYVRGYDWNATDLFGESYSCCDVIMHRAIREMGNACREPLLRRCRDWKNLDFIERDDESRLLLAMLKEHPFSEFFDEMVQFYAQQNRGVTTLMAFRDPRLVGLLKTMLRKNDLFGQLESGVRSAFLVELNNPVLEPTIRDFIAKEISYLDEEKAGNILTTFADSRRNYAWVDQEELALRIRSLDVGTEQKAEALRYLNLSTEKESNDIVRFYPEGKSYETDDEKDQIGFSMKETEALLKEHQDWSIEKALETLLGEDASEKNIDRAKHRLLIDAMQQGMETIVRKYWDEADRRERILQFVRSWHSDDYRIEQQNKLYEKSDNTYRQETLYLPGSGISIIRHEYGFYVDQYTGIKRENSLDYLLDRFDTLDDPEDCVYLPSAIRSSKTPEAKRLLEKWSRSSNPKLRNNAEKALDWWTTHAKLWSEGRKRYDDLIAGRITPDEIAPPPTAWIWDGEKYVAEKNTEEK